MLKKFEFRKSDPKKNWQDFSLWFFVPRSPEMLQVNQNANQTSSPGSSRKISRQSAILGPKNRLGPVVNDTTTTACDCEKARYQPQPQHPEAWNRALYPRLNELFYTEPPFASHHEVPKQFVFWRISRQIRQTFDSDGRFLLNFRGKLRCKREK